MPSSANKFLKNKLELFILETFLFISAKELKILKFIILENLTKSLIVHI